MCLRLLSTMAVVLLARPTSDTCFLTLPSLFSLEPILGSPDPRLHAYLPTPVISLLCRISTDTAYSQQLLPLVLVSFLYTFFARLHPWAPPLHMLAWAWAPEGHPGKSRARLSVLTAAGSSPFHPFQVAPVVFCTAPVIGRVHTHSFSPARLSVSLPHHPLFPILLQGALPAAAWVSPSCPCGACFGCFPFPLPMLSSSLSETSTPP